MGEEIPIWVEGGVQWLSGVDRRTTVKDVIELFIEGGAGGDTASYEIVERWREVERPLDSDSRLLKIWHHWGSEKKEVRLCLRRVDHENDSGRGSPGGATPSLKRRINRKSSKGSWNHSEGLHPRRLAELGGFNPEEYQEYELKRLATEEGYTLGEKTYVTAQEAGHVRRKGHRGCSNTAVLHSTAIESSARTKKCCSKRSKPKVRNSENIEKLMKLILAQGATIQGQLQKLKDREDQIENIEVERHKERAEKNGRNYLLETYLKGLKDAEVPVTDEEKGNDSGVHTEAGSEQTNEKEPVRLRKNSDAGPSRGRTRTLADSERAPRSKSENRSSESEVKKEMVRTLSENTVCDTPDKPDADTKEEKEDIVELRRVQSQVEMWEKVLKINKKLEKEEENLVKLHIQIRRIQSENIKFARDDTPADPVTQSIQNELETLRTDLDQNSKEIYSNFTKLIEDDEQVVKKQNYLSELISEFERTDNEHAMLSEMVQATCEPPVELPAENIGIILQVKGQEKPPDLIPEASPPDTTPVASLPGSSSTSQRTPESAKPKIHKISFDDVVQSNEVVTESSPISHTPSPIPNRNLKSILKNKHQESFQLGDIEKIPVHYGSNISSETSMKVEKSPLPPYRHPQEGCSNPLYSTRPSNSFTAAMENPYEHLFPKHRREAIYEPGSPPGPPYPEPPRTTLPGPPYPEPPRTSLPGPPYPEPPRASCPGPPYQEPSRTYPGPPYPEPSRTSYPAGVLVTTRAIVHDNDSSGSSDTSGLSSMYSASPTIEEPTYVFNTLV